MPAKRINAFKRLPFPRFDDDTYLTTEIIAFLLLLIPARHYHVLTIIRFLSDIKTLYFFDAFYCLYYEKYQHFYAVSKYYMLLSQIPVPLFVASFTTHITIKLCAMPPAKCRHDEHADGLSAIWQFLPLLDKFTSFSYLSLELHDTNFTFTICHF